MFRYLSQMKNSSRSGVAFCGLIAAAWCVLMTVSCESTKNSKGPEPVGKKVQMVELRQVLETQIADPNRSTVLLGMAGQAESELGAINKDYAKYGAEFGKMSADYKKTANDLSLFLRGWDTRVHAQRQKLVNVMIQMKGQTTREEWPHVSRAFMNSVMAESDRYREMRQMGY